MVELKLTFESIEELKSYLQVHDNVNEPTEIKVQNGPYRNGKAWTSIEDETICREYPWKKASVIAKALHRSTSSVQQRSFMFIKKGIIKKKNRTNSRAVII